MPDNFSVSIDLASFNFRNGATEVNAKNRWTHYGLFHRTMNFLTSIGFTVTKDPRIERDYKILSKDHRYGRKGDLEFKAERYPAGFKIEFYQNVVHENKCGGEYDFDKFEKMPYLIKKQFLLVCKKLREFFTGLGYAEKTKIEAQTAEEKVKKDFVESFHHQPKDMNFDLLSYDGLTSTMPPSSYAYEFHDRDEKVLRNGEIKYFRDYNGYLCRGKIYHRLNNMFWIILNQRETAIRADFELFDLHDSDSRGRVSKKEPPKEYTEKVEFLDGLTTKELERELKKRRITKKRRREA